MTIAEISSFSEFDLENKLAEYVINHLEEQKKISRLDGVDDAVRDTFRTIAVISSLGKDECRVIDTMGIGHNISEYEVCPQFERICTCQGVYFDDSDFAKNLKVTSNDVFKVLHIESEIMKGEVPTAKEISKAHEISITVPMTPALFRSAQVKIVNSMKGNIDHWTSINEVTKPMILSSIKVFSDGTSVTDPNGDWTVLPIAVTIISDIYQQYKFTLPLEEYLDKFAMHFVSNL